MGWTYFNSTRFGKEDLIAHFRDPSYWGDRCRLLGDAVVGNNYWATVEHLRPIEDTNIQAGDRFVFLALMRSGYPERGWGYKDLDESSGPFETNCPLRLLDLAGTPREGFDVSWRENVRACHAARSAEAKARNTLLEAGAVLPLSGEEYKLEESLGRRGWRVTRLRDGAPFRMPSIHITQALRQLQVLQQASQAN